MISKSRAKSSSVLMESRQLYKHRWQLHIEKDKTIFFELVKIPDLDLKMFFKPHHLLFKLKSIPVSFSVDRIGHHILFDHVQVSFSAEIKKQQKSLEWLLLKTKTKQMCTKYKRKSY
jgi:hypothetical protein